MVITVNLCLTENIKKQLEKMNKISGLTQSDIVRRAIEEYYENHYMEKVKS